MKLFTTLHSLTFLHVFFEPPLQLFSNNSLVRLRRRGRPRLERLGLSRSHCRSNWSQVRPDQLRAHPAEDVLLHEVVLIYISLGERPFADLAVEEDFGGAGVAHLLGHVRVGDVGQHGLGAHQRRAADHALQLHVVGLDVRVERRLLGEGARAELALEDHLDLELLVGVVNAGVGVVSGRGRLEKMRKGWSKYGNNEK